MAKKPFVNPLTRSSEKELHLPQEQTGRGEVVAAPTPVKKKAETFEETHERFTGWLRKDLKQQFNDLVKEEGINKTALLNEAIESLLHKRERKPYTRKNPGE